MPEYITSGYKSIERKQKNGEVFTPDWLVRQMCDIVESSDPDAFAVEKTFLEPACGTGNFLVEIFRRKLLRCGSRADALAALGTIYGCDIMPDNVADSRSRLLDMFAAIYGIDARAEKIVINNIICANFLETLEFLDNLKEDAVCATE